MAKEFSTVTTITKGTLTPGEWVEMTCVLTTISTGKHHRTVDCGGFYVGQELSDGDVPYHYFANGYIGTVPQTMFGFPVDNFPTAQETVKLVDLVPELAKELKMPAELVHMWCRQASITLNIAWSGELPAADAAAITDAVRAKHGNAAAKVKEAQARARRKG